MIVLDASAAIELLVPGRARGRRIAQRIAPEMSVHVPALFDVEVLHALRGMESARTIDDTALTSALADLADLRASRHDHELLRPRIWELRHNFGAYDATYVALAEVLDAPLVTTDARLSRGSGHNARIELVAG